MFSPACLTAWGPRPASTASSAVTGTNTCLGTNQATPQHTNDATAASQNTSLKAASAGSCAVPTVTVTVDSTGGDHRTGARRAESPKQGVQPVGRGGFGDRHVGHDQARHRGVGEGGADD